MVERGKQTFCRDSPVDTSKQLSSGQDNTEWTLKHLLCEAKQSFLFSKSNTLFSKKDWKHLPFPPSSHSRAALD